MKNTQLWGSHQDPPAHVVRLIEPYLMFLSLEKRDVK